MDYRRKYLKKLAGNQNEPSQTEEKEIIKKKEEKPSEKNVYLHKLLEKTKEVPKGSQINITSVNESLPFFSSNIREILASEENKQRAIKYVIHKRYGEKATLRSPIPTQSNEDQEESNPALSNRYYKNAKNLNLNLRGNATNENSRYDIKENNYNTDFKPLNLYQRNKLFQNQENNMNQENIIHYQNYPKRPDLQNPYVKRRMQVSSSTNRLGNNFNYDPENQNYNNYHNMIYNRKVRQFNLSTNRSNENFMDNNRNSSQERGILKFVEEVKNRNQYKLNDYVDTKPIKFSATSNFSFGLRDMGTKTSLDSSNIKMLRNGLDYKIIKNSFQIINNRNTILSSTFSKKFGRPALLGKNEEKKEYTRNNKKDKVIELNILSTNKDDETPKSGRHKRKFGRFSNQNQTENLSFKDEKEIVEFLNKKYKQDKIMDLFEIKPLERKSRKNDDELKNITEQLNKEIKKNKDNETKLKQMESNINAKNEEIKNKNKEMEELKNDNIFYEEELQKKEKEIEEIKNKIPKENKNKKTQIDEEFDKLKNEFDEFKKKYDEISKKYDNIKKDNEQNIIDYNKLLIENEQNKKDYNELLKDYEDLEKESEQNEKKNKELDDLKKELQDALNEKNKINDENKANIQKNEELTKELEKLKKDNEANTKNPTESKKKGKKNKKFKEFEKSDIDDNKLKSENENLKEEVNVLKGEINKYNNEYNDAKKENENLQKEMNELKDLNSKIKEENDKIKGELQNSKKHKENNDKQKKELDDTKSKYNTLLEEYEKIKQNLNSLDNEKSLIKNEQKQLLDDYKKTQEENEKIKKDLVQLKQDYDSILKENESLKENKENKPEKQLSIKTILKNKDIDIKKEEKPLSKSLQPPLDNKIKLEKDSEKKLTTINNIITDVNTNINDIINKINSNIEANNNTKTNNDTNNDLSKNASAEVSVSFSVEEDKDKDDKKNLRLRKALQRGKRKNNNLTEGDSEVKLNKSVKISSLAKQLENNIQIRDTLKSEGNESSKNVVYEQHESKDSNLADILDNQTMSKSIKKKKKKRKHKQFTDFEEGS